MASTILTSANLYAEMAGTFYENYLRFEQACQDLPQSFDVESDPETINKTCYYLNGKRKNAVAATVFQALAIEAYINLLGMYSMGEEEYYRRFEKKPPTEKLKKICNFIGRSYPKDHLSQIRAFFDDKRNPLAHEKPRFFPVEVKPFDVMHPEKSYEDIEEFFREDNYLYSNIGAEKNLYRELQDHVKTVRNAEKELIEEIQEKQLNDCLKEMAQAIGAMFGLNGANDHSSELS